MKTALIIATLALCLFGCDFRSSVNLGAANSRKVESQGVIFLVPVESGSVMGGDLGFRFDGETIKAEMKGDILYVDGTNYGALRRGDIVDLTAYKRVVINGVERRPMN